MTAGPVLGIVGNDVPRQLVLAAGAMPRRLTGSWTGEVSVPAQEHLGAVDRPVVTILTALLEGDRPDAIVVCSDSQAHVRLFYVLRMLSASGLPPVHLLDLPRQDSPSARRFAEVQLRALARFCAGLGSSPDAADWGSAAAHEHAVGDAAARLRARREARHDAVSGTAALRALLAAAASPPAEATALLDAARAPAPEGPRVHVTGSNHPDADVYAALEASGMRIVSDDHDTGDLSWLGAAVDSGDEHVVIAGLADAHFARAASSPVALVAERAATTREAVRRSGAEVALALVRSDDEAPLWDLAAAAAALDAEGVALHRRSGIAPADLPDVVADAAAAVAREAGVGDV